MITLVVLLFITHKSTINIGNGIKLRKGADRTIVIVNNQKIIVNDIYDLWFQDGCLYGYHYDNNRKYGLFFLEVLSPKVYYDLEASNLIYKNMIPTNQWTNYSEIFTNSISDYKRREKFLENIAIYNKNKK